MSHIVEIHAEVRDPAALAAACRRLRLAAPEPGTAQLFAGTAAGLIVRLPGWRYPVVAEPESGMLKYDHYNGQWGDPGHLDRLLQAYAVEKATLEARRRGHAVREARLPDGAVKLTVQVGGAS
jgi:hypothetical protein